MTDSGRDRSTILRAREIDRVAVAAALDLAYADGQLDYDEYRLRTTRARSATTLVELRELAFDLQSDVALPDTAPLRHRGARRRWVYAGLALVAAAAVTVGVQVSREGARFESQLTQSDVAPLVFTPISFDTAAGLEDFRARYLARFGDTTVVSVYIDVGDRRATVERVTPAGEKQSVAVDGGFDPSPQTVPRTASDRDIDWSALDMGRLAERLASAPEELGAPNADVDSVNLRVNASTDRPEVRIDVRAPSRGVGTVVVDLAGNTLSVEPR